MKCCTGWSSNWPEAEGGHNSGPNPQEWRPSKDKRTVLKAAAAGRRIELVVKADTGTPDVTKRLAQELVVNDKVDVLAGFGLTPPALAAAPIATQSKTPMVNMLAATASVVDASPHMIRVSLTLPQITLGVAEWAPKNKIRKVVTLVSDYGPGIERVYGELYNVELEEQKDVRDPPRSR